MTPIFSAVVLGGAQLIPVDTRPESTIWIPPISLGTAGWRQSTTPFCDTHQGAPGPSGVWADDRGVYALAQTGCAPNGDTMYCTGAEGWGLQYNDGTGWRWVYGDATGVGALRGFPGGPAALLDYAPGSFQYGHMIFVNSDGTINVQPPLPGATFALGKRIFALGADHAYVLSAEASAAGDDLTSVFEYKSGSWEKLVTLSMRGSAVWAANDRIIVVGNGQTIYQRTAANADFLPVAGAPAGDYAGVWAFNDTEIWASNGLQLVHFDGNAWKILSTDNSRRIGQLWGFDGELYYSSFGSDATIHHWNGTLAEPLMQFPTSQSIWVTDLWMVSKTSVFLAVQDSTLSNFKCGGTLLVWFDGESFHQF